MAGMQKKSINAYINARIRYWVWSLNDPIQLASILKLSSEDKEQWTPNDKATVGNWHIDVHNATIVTGGAIASMLLGDEVNDLDVYFKTQDIARQIATYYLNKTFHGTQEHPFVGQKSVIDNDSGGVAVMIKSQGVTGESIDNDNYSYFENMSYNDIDQFFDKYKKTLKGEQPKHSVKFITSNAITLNNDIQLILRFTGEPETIHENYDFVHATNYWTLADGVVYRPEALQSLLEKRLVYVGSRFPIASLFRIRKFIARGYHISAGQITKIAFDVSKLDLTDPSVLHDQLIGVDYAYFNQVIRLLQNPTENSGLDGQAIDRTYLFKIIDQVYEGSEPTYQQPDDATSPVSDQTEDLSDIDFVEMFAPNAEYED